MEGLHIVLTLHGTYKYTYRVHTPHGIFLEQNVTIQYTREAESGKPIKPKRIDWR